MTSDELNDLLEALREARYRGDAAAILIALSRLGPETAHLALESFESLRTSPLDGLEALSREQWSSLTSVFKACEATTGHGPSSPHIPLLQSWGRILTAGARWRAALSIHQMLLLHFNKLAGDDERRDLYHRLGLIRVGLGQVPRARHMFERALKLDPTHQPTLEALGTLPL